LALRGRSLAWPLHSGLLAVNLDGSTNVFSQPFKRALHLKRPFNL
jgi:hypothetical protein